jgi:hypothetical protein
MMSWAVMDTGSVVVSTQCAYFEAGKKKTSLVAKKKKKKTAGIV